MVESTGTKLEQSDEKNNADITCSENKHIDQDNDNLNKMGTSTANNMEIDSKAHETPTFHLVTSILQKYQPDQIWPLMNDTLHAMEVRNQGNIIQVADANPFHLMNSFYLHQQPQLNFDPNNNPCYTGQSYTPKQRFMLPEATFIPPLGFPINQYGYQNYLPVYNQNALYQDREQSVDVKTRMGCYNPAYSSNSNPTPVGACFTPPMTNFSIPQYSYGQLVDPDLQRIEQLSKQSRLSTEPNKAYDEKSTKKSTSEKKVKKAKKETSEIQSLPSEEVNSKNGKTLAIPLLPSIEENKARAEKSIKTSPPPEVSKPHEETSPKSLPPTTEVNMETSEISMKKLSQSPNKADVQTSKKRNRHVFTKNQLEILILEFEKNPFVSFKKTRELSKDLNITEKQVTVWFKNRRMKMRSNNIPIWRVKIV